jgi:SAM-dependent methyltransferase
MAQRVPEGQVLAVDIQPEMLDIIENRKARTGIGNITTVLGNERDPNLDPCSVDLVLLVDAYHEFSYPYEMGRGMADALKPGGKLVLIEYRGEDPTVPIKPLHKMTEQQARREMAAVGLEWKDTLDMLPQQHFMIFQRSAACTPGEDG